MRSVFIAVLLSVAFSINAADDESAALESLPETPTPPPPVHSGEAIEPDITIIKRGKKTIQEFRRGGRLYMIKVIPDIGPAYYFLDTNGDGKLDARSNDLDYGSHINMWKIFEWD
ncbi:DUF2782 domain-containing protein [Methylocucumis oryzae]|uniref:DUF2782 domain-containing protein n=1 Tax=Methylocucumis oryzae TaxID=1632867 RepID=UPI0006960B2C|nr:DUF2782 domain-containing protein [Methylocucumis oryzae]